MEPLNRIPFVLLFLTLAALPATVALAQGDPLGHSDRAASLYRVVVTLDGTGNPTLPVAVLSRQEHVEVISATGLRVIGTGDGQVEFRLPPDRPMDVSATDAKPGVYQHFVVLAQAPSDDLDTLRRLRGLWKERGLPVKALTSGTTYSLAGRMLDTRKTLLCLDVSYPKDEAAQARAAELGRQYGEDLSVYAIVAEPPSAQLVARARDGSEVQAADVLWFEAVKAASGRNAPLKVIGTRHGTRTELELPGRIYVVPGQGGGLEVVNEAEIERILEGVVAAEIFANAPADALRAQAVATRTDMLAKVGTRHVTDPYAICSDVHCQAYGGMQKVSARIAQAVADTKGQVLVDPDGRLVDAYYHAVSGGHTENNENAWPGRPQPSLRGQPDQVAGGVDHLANGPSEEAVAALLADKDASWAGASGLNQGALRWKVDKTPAELATPLQAVGVTQALAAIRVLHRGVSGRATSVELTLADGKKVTIAGELRIRRAFGGLKSSLFLVQPGPAGAGGVPARWTFTGAGFGHGVGMCQTGAVGRAKAGQDFKTILGHYYTAAHVEQLY